MTDPSPPYDSGPDTLAHIHEVRLRLFRMTAELLDRAATHDLSKLAEPEKSAFDRATPALAALEYGSPEYEAARAGLGAALAHHYAHNRHHPEFGEPGLEWQAIAGYEGLYEVSNYGDVRSVDRQVKRAGTRGDLRLKGRPLSANVTPKGYLRLQLSRGDSTRNYLVHRLVADAFIPNPDDKPEVNHRDGNKTNNRATNLEWATESENLQHAYDTGLKEPAVKYVVRCPELDLVTLGTEKMAAAVQARGYPKATRSGVWLAMDRGGTHCGLTFEGTLLQEWRRSRLLEMTLVDLLEMLCDWAAAVVRHADKPGHIARSIELNRARFGYGDELARILTNTARELLPADWSRPIPQEPPR